MPFIDRNDAGEITGVFACEQYSGQEFLPVAELPTPESPVLQNPVEKLREFLLANPDVAAIL